MGEGAACKAPTPLRQAYGLPPPLPGEDFPSRPRPDGVPRDSDRTAVPQGPSAGRADRRRFLLHRGRPRPLGRGRGGDGAGRHQARHVGRRRRRENLDNVAVKLGAPDNPMLPQASFDRVFLVHMYHEVASPYAFLWHLRDSVKPDGLIVVVDSNRPIERHGIPPAQLKCEFGALAMTPVNFRVLTGGEVYLTAFRIAGAKPAHTRSNCGDRSGTVGAEDLRKVLLA